MIKEAFSLAKLNILSDIKNRNFIVIKETVYFLLENYILKPSESINTTPARLAALTILQEIIEEHNYFFDTLLQTRLPNYDLFSFLAIAKECDVVFVLYYLHQWMHCHDLPKNQRRFNEATSITFLCNKPTLVFFAEGMECAISAAQKLSINYIKMSPSTVANLTPISKEWLCQYIRESKIAGFILSEDEVNDDSLNSIYENIIDIFNRTSLKKLSISGSKIVNGGKVLPIFLTTLQSILPRLESLAMDKCDIGSISDWNEIISVSDANSLKQLSVANSGVGYQHNDLYNPSSELNGKFCEWLNQFKSLRYLNMSNNLFVGFIAADWQSLRRTLDRIKICRLDNTCLSALTGESKQGFLACFKDLQLDHLSLRDVAFPQELSKIRQGIIVSELFDAIESSLITGLDCSGCDLLNEDINKLEAILKNNKLKVDHVGKYVSLKSGLIHYVAQRHHLFFSSEVSAQTILPDNLMAEIDEALLEKQVKNSFKLGSK